VKRAIHAGGSDQVRRAHGARNSLSAHADKRKSVELEKGVERKVSRKKRRPQDSGKQWGAHVFKSVQVRDCHAVASCNASRYRRSGIGVWARTEAVRQIHIRTET